MAATSIIHAEIDPAIKQEATAVLESHGLTLSKGIELFLTQVAENQCVLDYLHQPNAETIETFKAIDRGEVTSASSVEDLFRQLHAED